MTTATSIRVTPEQEHLMDMHSVLNLFNIIVGELHLIQMDLVKPEILEPPIQKIMAMKNLLHSEDREDFTPAVMQDFQDSVMASLQLAESLQPELLENEEYQNYKANFKGIFQVFNIRLDELLTRWAMPDKWEIYTIESFKNDFEKFLTAIEKHAKGSYRIIYNIAEQSHSDYLVHLDVSSTREDEVVAFPLLFKDVMRDLVSNARKYTPPGGHITIGLAQLPKSIRFVVEDTGIGIPRSELNRVLEFGYRASNVHNKRTMGGGFGLTKAVYVTQKFNGTLDLQSEEDEGTKITITLPLPEEMWDD